MPRLRPARHEEIKDHFYGVDPQIVWDLYMADFCFIDTENDSFVFEDVTRMFAFLMRRMFPAESHSDE